MRNHQRCAWVLFVGSFFACGPAIHAATHPISSYDRLRGAIVRGIFQDSDAFVWLASDTGLWRWSFGDFTPLDSDDVCGVKCFGAVEDRSGRLWVATDNGLIGIDRRHMKPIPGKGALNGIPIRAMCHDRSGAIWLGTTRGGLYRFRPWLWETDRTALELVSGTDNWETYTFACDANGHLWVGSKQMIHEIVIGDDGEIATPILRYESLAQAGVVQAIHRAADGSLWIGMRHEPGLFRVRGDEIQKFGPEHGLHDDRANVITEDRFGDIWVGTEAGVFRWSADRFTAIDKDTGLPNEDIHALWVDREDQVWVGSYGGGVFRIRSPHVLTYGYEDGMPHPTITTIANDPRSQDLVVGTINGLVRFDPVSLQYTKVGPPVHVEAVHVTDQGRIWYTSPAPRVYNDEGFATSHFSRVYALDSDPVGNLYFGNHAGHLYRFKDGLTESIDLPEDLRGPIRLVAAGLDNDLFVGASNGLFYRTNDRWTRLWPDEEVWSMLQASDERLWVGTDRALFIGRATDWTRIEPRWRDAHPIRALVEDDHGVIWAATADGLLRITESHVDRLMQVDGLPSSDVHCLAIDDGGTLFAGTSQGLARIEADRLVPCVVPPVVSVRQFIAGGEIKSISPDPIELSYDQRSVIVETGLVGWRNVGDWVVQYRVDGPASSWSSAAERWILNVPPLSPGRRAIEIRATHPNEPFAGESLRLPISLHGPVWHELWFRFVVGGALALFLAAAAYLVHRRWLAERRVRQSDERLQAIIDNSPAIIYVKDREGRYLLVNRQFEQKCGVPRSQAIGHTDHDVFPRDRADAFRANDERVLATGAAIEFDEVAPHADGPHDFISLKFPLTDPKGKAYAVCGISTDITARKLAEAKLRDSEERFRKIFIESPLGMVFTGLDLRFIAVNDAFCEFTGFTRDELIGRSYADITHPDDIARDRAQLQRLHDGDVPFYRVQKRYLKKNKTVVWGHLTVSILRDSQGNPIHGLAMIEDITERLRVAERARLHEEQLIHLTRVATMGEMASAIAHQINQPLAAIINYAAGCKQRLLASDRGDGAFLTVIGAISEQANRAAAIIRHLKDLIRREPSERESIDIRKIVERAVAATEPEARRVGAILREEYHAVPAQVVVDPIQIEQVMINLLRNAIAAVADQPTGLRSVTARTSRNGAAVLKVSVTDTGTGPESMTQRDMFEPFISRKPEGLGMGLPIARTIVEAHGGKIWSEPNRFAGMTFHFTLPINCGESTDEP